QPRLLPPILISSVRAPRRRLAGERISTMISRRRFVHGSIAAGALVGLGAGSWAIPPSTSATSAGLDPNAFAEALRAMRGIVGDSFVFAEEPQLVGYRDHFAMKPPEAHAASAAVAPKRVEEIQQLLAAAREHGIPAWTISTGRSLGYGGPAPARPGARGLGPQRRNRVPDGSQQRA